MRGLLQKDIYQMIKYQRVLMLIVVIFAIAAAVNQGNAFFTVYPAVIAGLSTVTLQSYDEQGGFPCFSAVMPVSRKAVVGAKYIYGVAVVFLVVLLETVSYLAFQNPVPETARNVGNFRSDLRQYIPSVCILAGGRTGTDCLCNCHGCILCSDASFKGTDVQNSKRHHWRSACNQPDPHCGILLGICCGIYQKRILKK